MWRSLGNLRWSTLLQIGDSFALNILSEKDFKKPLKRFTKPFAPGEDRFEGINIELTPNEQIIIPESLAWLDAVSYTHLRAHET